MKRLITRFNSKGLLWVIPTLFITLFFFYPLVTIFKTSFERIPSNGILSIPWSLILKRVGFTFWQAGLSTFFSFLIGLPTAFLFARYSFPGRKVLQVITSLPFMLPTVVVAAGFTAVVGPNGFLNSILTRVFHLSNPPIQIMGTLTAIILAHVFYNVTIVLRLVGGTLARLDPRYAMTARTLGANRWQVIRWVTFPLIRPVVIAALVLVFLFDFTSFGVILLLGSPQTATLEVEVYNQTMNLFNLPLAGILTLIQLLITLFLSIVYRSISANQVVSNPVAESDNLHPLQTVTEKLSAGIMVSILIVLIVLPLASLIGRSLIPISPSGSSVPFFPALSLQYYIAMFQNPRQSFFYIPPANAVLFSLQYGILTAVISLVLGILLSYALRTKSVFAKAMDAIWYLPLGASAVTLGLGILLAFSKAPFNWLNSNWLIPFVHSLVALPFVLRTISPALNAIPPELRQAAAVLGQSPVRVFLSVDLPILRQAIVSALIFGFTISLGEFGATTFLARPDAPTIPVAIFRYLSHPGSLNYGQAMAMASILLVICSAGILSAQLFHLPNSEM